MIGKEPVFFDGFFHEIDRFYNGQKWGKLGSMKFLIDEQNIPTSLGYHEIRPKFNGGYVATLHGTGEIILDDMGKEISKPPAIKALFRSIFN